MIPLCQNFKNKKLPPNFTGGGGGAGNYEEVGVYYNVAVNSDVVCYGLPELGVFIFGQFCRISTTGGGAFCLEFPGGKVKK